MSLQMLERLALNEFSGKAWAPYLSSRKQVQALVGPPEKQSLIRNGGGLSFGCYFK